MNVRIRALKWIHGSGWINNSEDVYLTLIMANINQENIRECTPYPEIYTCLCKAIGYYN